MERIFVGIGFGAIQTGLFLREAQRSGNFDRYVVAMRRPDIATAVNRDGRVTVNIAMPDGISVETYSNIEARCLSVPGDIRQLDQDMLAAHEISVAVSSVSDYVSDHPDSLHRLIARAVSGKQRGKGPKVLIYSSENHNEAASLLEQAILSALPEGDRPDARSVFQTVDTVIGKMSRVIRDVDEIQEAELTTFSSEGTEAFLVEAFNSILVSQVDLSRTSGRGISQLVEKADLIPFEHAKIHGHNATHAGFAYIGQVLGLKWMADVAAIPQVYSFFRDAFIDESGAALIHLHGGKDPLFTVEGYRAYVDDLLARMANPWLRDTCDRIGRDVSRKLGWDDRLIGTIRLVRGQNLSANRYSYAALAAFEIFQQSPDSMVHSWVKSGADQAEAEDMAQFLLSLHAGYRDWRAALPR
jgi:mannitol-1-phosphate 5-dehydrogenase